MIAETSISKICSMNDTEYEKWLEERDLDFELAEQKFGVADVILYLKYNNVHIPETNDLIMATALELAVSKEIEKEVLEMDHSFYPLQNKCKAFCLGWNGIDTTCDCGTVLLEWKAFEECSFMDVLVKPKGEVL